MEIDWEQLAKELDELRPGFNYTDDMHKLVVMAKEPKDDSNPVIWEKLLVVFNKTFGINITETQETEGMEEQLAENVEEKKAEEIQEVEKEAKKKESEFHRIDVELE